MAIRTAAKPEAESEEQQQPEGDAMQGHGQQQDHQRPMARDDAAGNPEGKETSQGDPVGYLVAVGMAMPVVVVFLFAAVTVVPVIVVPVIVVPVIVVPVAVVVVLVVMVTVIVIPVVVRVSTAMASQPLQMTGEQPYAEGHDQNP